MSLSHIAKLAILAGGYGFVFGKDVAAQRLADATLLPQSRASSGVISLVISPTQKQLRAAITVELNDVTLEEALIQVSRISGVRIGFGRDVYDSKQRVTLRVDRMPGDQVLALILKGTGLRYVVTPDGAVVIDSVPSSSQQQEKVRSITGRVVDSATKSGIGGAAVSLSGSNISAVTSEDGRFLLRNVPMGSHTVLIKLFGYRSTSVSFNVGDSSMTPITIMLTAIPTSLTGVVTTATGNQRRVEVANDIASLNVDSLMQTAPITNVSELLSVARIPGVEVTPSGGTPGAPSRIRIRGVGSIEGNNDPIVFVDGIRVYAPTSTNDIRNTAAAAGAAGGYLSSPLDAIDPASIEKIEVLRGPSAAAMYGMDAANGIILITTKKGQAGKTRWSVRFDHGWSDLSHTPVPDRWLGLGILATTNGEGPCPVSKILINGCVPTRLTRVPDSSGLFQETGGWRGGYSTTLSGGSQTLQYAMTLSTGMDNGPLTMWERDRELLRSWKEPIPQWLNRPNTKRDAAFSTRLTALPRTDVDLDLSLQVKQDNIEDNALGLSDRLAGSYTKERNKQRNDGIGLAFNGTWRAPASIVTTLTAGFDKGNRASDLVVRTLNGCSENGCKMPITDLVRYRENTTMTTVRVKSSIPMPLTRWSNWLAIRPTIGGDLVRRKQLGTTMTADSIVGGYIDPNAAGNRDLRDFTDRGENSASAGWWINFQIGMLSRLYTDFAIRSDAGNAIGFRARAPKLPKMGTSWLISDERFFPKTRSIRALRLRGAIGYAVNQPSAEALTGRYNSAAMLIEGLGLPYYVGDLRVAPIDLVGLGNQTLRPERSLEYEYGADLDALGDRLQVEFTVATKRNTDELIQRTIAPSVGLLSSSSRYENIGRVLNRSVEVSTNARILERSGMTWNIGIRAASLVNRVEELGDGVSPFGENSARIVPGYPVKGVWMKPILGYSDSDNDGRLLDSDIIFGDSLVYVGWAHPRYSLSYNTSLSGWNGRVQITANLAHDVGISQIRTNVPDMSRVDYDLNASLEDQILRVMGRRNGLRGVLAGDVQTVDQLSFTAASMSIHLPGRMLAYFRARTGTFSLLAQNLALWTNFRGRDPRINSSPIGEGLQNSTASIPLPRRYQVRINLNY